MGGTTNRTEREQVDMERNRNQNKSWKDVRISEEARERCLSHQNRLS